MRPGTGRARLVGRESRRACSDGGAACLCGPQRSGLASRAVSGPSCQAKPGKPVTGPAGSFFSRWPSLHRLEPSARHRGHGPALDFVGTLTAQLPPVPRDCPPGRPPELGLRCSFPVKDLTCASQGLPHGFRRLGRRLFPNFLLGKTLRLFPLGKTHGLSQANWVKSYTLVFAPSSALDSCPPLARFSPRIGNYGEDMTLSTNKSTHFRPRTDPGPTRRSHR